jgi:RimJ/RimL family protein N-acetyltransferase
VSSRPPSIVLERLGPQHLAEIDALTADADVLRFTRVPEPVPEDFSRTWLARYEAGQEDETCAGFAALDDDGRFLGLALAPSIDNETGEVELGYVVAPAARGRGVASELLRRLTRWAFDEAGAQRVVLLIDVENAASSRVAARAGYVREGVLRSSYVKPGPRRDIELWSRLPSDGRENRAAFTVGEAIETERLILRPFRPSDLEDVHAIRSRPDVVRYLYGDVRSRQEVEEFLAERVRLTSLREDDDGLALAAERRDDGRVIGEVTLWLRSAEHRQGEIGFVFHPDAQGRGYAREAATAMLQLAFGQLGLHRVFGRMDARNEASAALMRRLGMRQEAHLRQNEIFKGAWEDELVFAALGDEWSA